MKMRMRTTISEQSRMSANEWYTYTDKVLVSVNRLESIIQTRFLIIHDYKILNYYGIFEDFKTSVEFKFEELIYNSIFYSNA